MLHIIILSILALAHCVSSQTIDPESVDYTTKSNWCDNSQAQCGLLCSQIQNGSVSTSDNSCDPDTLNYACVCDNGLTPPLKEYSLTIPYYECTTALAQCETACPTSNTGCQQQCRVVNKCGAQNPTRYNISTTTTSSAPGSEATDGSGNGGLLINGDGASDASGAAKMNARGITGVYGVVGVAVAAVAGGLMVVL